MGHSQIEKQRTHERIVEIAARRLREEGLDGIGVADLMKEAGLTVGGFYKHFDSRDDLVREAMQTAFRSWEKRLEEKGRSPSDVSMDEYLAAYLSRAHRDDPGDGCAFAALNCDLARSDAKTRESATLQICTNIDLMTGRMPDVDQAMARRKAILAVCAAAGAIGFARVVDDPSLSDEILRSVRDGLAAMAKADADPAK